MKINCRHGYFIVHETEPGEVGRFSSVYDVELAAFQDFYTFPFLIDAGNYSLESNQYLNLAAVETYEGDPWEVLRANGFVYDLGLDLLIPVTSITAVITLQESDFYYVSSGLIQPGSLLKSGQRLVDYTAWFDWKSSTFRYTEIGFL